MTLTWPPRLRRRWTGAATACTAWCRCTARSRTCSSTWSRAESRDRDGALLLGGLLHGLADERVRVAIFEGRQVGGRPLNHGPDELVRLGDERLAEPVADARCRHRQ